MGGVAIGFLLVVSGALYTVDETKQVIITQFGKPVGEPKTEAGLKFKLPFIQQVNPVDKRILEWDGAPSNMPTKDKLYIAVDLFARWRIVDPLQYFLRLRDERSAQSRLDDILGSETRNAVAKHELIELVRTTNERLPDYARVLDWYRMPEPNTSINGRLTENGKPKRNLVEDYYQVQIENLYAIASEASNS